AWRPSYKIGGPLPRSRRAQMSELMRSESCQSGPCSNSTTCLPARVSTAAKTAPAAPAPTMTAATFSAMPPAPPGPNMRHVRHAQSGKALHGAVDHVDRIVAQDAVDRGLRGPLPALELVLAQAGDEIALLGLGQLGIAATEQPPARPLEAAQGGAVEIDIGR